MTVERYLAPTTVDEVVGALEEHGDDAKIVAGGQSLLVLMREGFVFPKVLIGLREVSELAGIEVNGEARIGALATHTEVLSHPAIGERWPVLAEAEAAVSTVQVRNRGTLCGNLAHAFPTADPPAALLALDAQVQLRGPQGSRTMGVDEFLVGVFTTALEPGEVLTAIRLPPQPEGSRFSYQKYAVRPLDFAIVGVATRLVVDADGVCTGARVGLNGGADHSIRALGAERILTGSSLEDDALTEAAAAAAAESTPMEDIDGTVAYKRRAIRAYVRRSLDQARHRS